MKELREYKNEIFRRSDEKKRQLKKRRRIAMGVGIPLCLCCLLTVTLLPQGRSKGFFAPTMEMVGNDCMVSEEAQIPEQSFRITDPEQVERVLLLLEEDQLPQKEEDNKNAIADQVMPGSYRLILELSDGSVLVYRMTDDQLHCETTQEHKTLTQAQTENLYKFLIQLSKEN
jgi:hypothetical protein